MEHGQVSVGPGVELREPGLDILGDGEGPVDQTPKHRRHQLCRRQDHRGQGRRPHEIFESAGNLERPHQIDGDDVKYGDHVPDVGEARAQALQGSEPGAVRCRDAEPTGDRPPVLQDQDDDHGGEDETNRLQEHGVAGCRQAELEGRLGDEIAVDGEVGEPPDPQEGVKGGFVGELDDAQRRHPRHQRHARHGEDGPGEHAGVDERERHQARGRIGLDQRQHAVGRGGEGGDRDQIEDGARRQEWQTQEQAVVLAALHRRPRASEQPAHDPFGHEPEPNDEGELGEQLDPQGPPCPIAYLGLEPAPKPGRLDHDRGRRQDLAAQLLDARRQAGEHLGADGFRRRLRRLRPVLRGDQGAQLLDQARARGVVLEGLNQRLKVLGRDGRLGRRLRRLWRLGPRRRTGDGNRHRQGQKNAWEQTGKAGWDRAHIATCQACHRRRD